LHSSGRALVLFLREQATFADSEDINFDIRGVFVLVRAPPTPSMFPLMDRPGNI
jgi:hypothetical protein